MLNVVVLANLKTNAPKTEGKPADFWADLDSERTVDAIIEALEGDGHRASFLEADHTIITQLPKLRPDICFNIAEGHYGESRTAQVPAILEMLQIPYTGSGVYAQARSLNKAVTKTLWLSHGLPTLPFQVFEDPDEELEERFEFPLFVKPVAAGTGMGISISSIVHDKKALHHQIAHIVQSYGQAAIIEPYLEGQEITVGVIGNKPNQYAFPPVGIDLDYLPDDKGVYGSRLKTTDKVMSPAALNDELLSHVRSLAINAHNTIGAKDISRVDIRFSNDGLPHLLEINLTPGLVKGFSDLCVAADLVRDYGWLINSIVYVACHRYDIDAPNVDFANLP